MSFPGLPPILPPSGSLGRGSGAEKGDPVIPLQVKTSVIGSEKVTSHRAEKPLTLHKALPLSVSSSSPVLVRVESVTKPVFSRLGGVIWGAAVGVRDRIGTKIGSLVEGVQNKITQKVDAAIDSAIKTRVIPTIIEKITEETAPSKVFPEARSLELLIAMKGDEAIAKIQETGSSMKKLALKAAMTTGVVDGVMDNILRVVPQKVKALLSKDNLLKLSMGSLDSVCALASVFENIQKHDPPLDASAQKLLIIQCLTGEHMTTEKFQEMCLKRVSQSISSVIKNAGVKSGGIESRVISKIAKELGTWIIPKEMVDMRESMSLSIPPGTVAPGEAIVKSLVSHTAANLLEFDQFISENKDMIALFLMAKLTRSLAEPDSSTSIDPPTEADVDEEFSSQLSNMESSKLLSPLMCRALSNFQPSVLIETVAAPWREWVDPSGTKVS